MTESTTEAELAELAITVYIEELATDKRVLYVGDAQSRGPEQLAKVARSVDLVSPRARTRGTRRGSRVRSRRWPGKDDDTRWDVVVVPDVDAAGLSEERQIDQVSAWLADGGVLVAATAGTERGLSYEGLFDLLQVNFDSVRMVGQAPFRGFSLVDFAPPGDLGVTFDGSLLDGAGEQAQRFLALCGDDDVVLDAYAVVQIPSSTSSAAPAPKTPRDTASQDGRVSQLNERVREQQDALDAANVHAEELERELDSLRGSLTSAKSDTAAAVRRAEQASKSLAELEAARRSLQGKLKEQREAAQKRSAAPSSSGGASEAEYTRLEARLRESGQQLTELQSELARRGVLVRDLIEELAEASALSADGPVSVAPESAGPEAVDAEAPGLMSTLAWSQDELQTALQEQVAASADRAVAAEADKAALEFTLDEVRSELALAEEKREEERRLEAALRGTVRGLNARLAEVTELYQQAQARLALAVDDGHSASEHNKQMERNLAEAREQLEIQLSRANAERTARAQAVTVPPDETSSEIAELMAGFAAREGELMGALSRCRNEAADFALEARRSATASDLAKQAVSEVEERVLGLRQGYEVRIAEIVAELDGIGAEAERAWVQNGELKAKLSAMEQTDAQQKGELMGTKLRLADREEAVSALVAQASTATPQEAPSSAELDALRTELTTVREEAESLRGQLAEAAESSDDDPSEGQSDASSGSGVAARDAMIGRLQSELAQATDRYRSLESDLSQNAAALAKQREKVEAARVEGAVEAEQSVRELEELTARLEQSESERAGAHTALGAAKAILSGLVKGLPAGAADGAPGTKNDDVRSLRERVGHLDAQAADREVIMRSLTAQLQERDDRIRALERFDVSDEESADVLRARALELEERTARLTEELENERAARRRLEEG